MSEKAKIRRIMSLTEEEAKAILCDLPEFPKTRIAQLEAALNGFLWLGNNLHNIEESPQRFRELYEAALEDARKVLPAPKARRSK